MTGEILSSDEVSTKRISFLDDQQDCTEIGSLADYCGLGHLHDQLLDVITDHELIIECKHCFIVECDEGDYVIYELHSNNVAEFKKELTWRIKKHIANSESISD